MQISQYSFLLVGALAWAFVSYSFWRVRTLPVWLRLGGIILLALMIFLVWFILRPLDTNGLTGSADPNKLIGGGKPVVLEFYSEY